MSLDFGEKMNKGGMSACIDSAFPGDFNTSVNIIDALHAQSSNICATKQVILVGNRCGHNPSNPRLFEPPANHKRRFPPIEQAKRNLANSYHDKFAYEFGKVFYHQDKPNSEGIFRQRRSESRESITCRIGQVLLHYANLANMAIGYIDPKTKKFVPYGVAFIADKCGASVNQTLKALRVLKGYGYIDIIPQTYKTPDGRYRSKDAIITVDINLYYDLDITEDQLIQYRKDQLIKDVKNQRRELGNSYRANQFKAKKEYKQIQKQLRQLPKPVNENPGAERKRETTPLYRDYTDIPKNRSSFTKKEFQGTPTAQNFLSSIMDKLKPKPA